MSFGSVVGATVHLNGAPCCCVSVVLHMMNDSGRWGAPTRDAAATGHERTTQESLGGALQCFSAVRATPVPTS